MNRLLSASLLLITLISIGAQKPPAESPEAASLKNLQWRSLGPANMGGRVTAIEGIPGDPYTFYVGTADGGIFKTTNMGTTFQALFQDQEVLSIGAIAAAPSDTNVVWVGTGEGDARNSASFGNGVYRSTDGGETWSHLGLENTERIKRIRVDPRDPDTAYVAALGHAWGPNEDRGVFKTTDAGKSWKKVLYLDQDTGCSDIDIDLSNPRILYAGMYTFRRKPWRFDSGGGATALYRTTDSGQTWKKLTAGLPRGSMDRIGVAVSRSQPSTVYMITEAKNEGELFRSDDRGDNWRMVSNDPNINFRPFYYSDIRVDPNDPERVYSLSGGLYMSRDGGRTFSRIANGVHGDHQALWIDPANSRRVLSGSDGGFQVSYDGTQTFEVINNLAISQFYHVAFDLRQPYSVCGGLQDNGNWCGPSQTLYREGIRKDDWYTVSGGDGFFAVPDPSSPNIVYSDSQGGNISVTDTNSGSTHSIHPYPKEVGSSGNAIADYKYRFNWNSPIVLSPHDPKTVYFGGNVLFKSVNYGQSWETISPDLTTNDKSKQQSSGGEVVVDNTAAEFHCTILTIAESPPKAGVIWAGTDDGNVQVTRDGGKTWTNVAGNIRGLPAHSWIPSIEASHFDAGTAYLAADRHRDDDFSPRAYRTTDYGQTWAAIQGDLPGKGYVHVIREDLKVKNLLYAGTELGIFASWDGGTHWASIRNNLPPVAVRDLAIHPRENDLIIGTHGRGLWILDDIGPLQELAAVSNEDAHLFSIRQAIRYQIWGKDANLGQKTYAAANPPQGAYIDYYLKSNASQAVTIEIKNARGEAIRTIRNNANRAGVQRVVWDLRYDSARNPAAAQPGGGPVAGGLGRGNRGGGAAGQRGARGGPGAAGGAVEGAADTLSVAEAQQAAAQGGGRFGGGGGPSVVPGDYTVTLKAAGKELSQVVHVSLDPRVRISAQDLQTQLEMGLALRELLSTLNAVVARIDDITRQLTLTAENYRGGSVRTSSAPDSQPGGRELVTSIEAARQELVKLRSRLVREGALNYRFAPKLREEVNSLMNSVTSAIAAPTEPQKLRLREVTADTQQAVTDLNGVIEKTIGPLNEKLGKLPRIASGPPLK